MISSVSTLTLITSFRVFIILSKRILFLFYLSANSLIIVRIIILHVSIYSNESFCSFYKDGYSRFLSMVYWMAFLASEYCNLWILI